MSFQTCQVMLPVLILLFSFGGCNSKEMCIKIRWDFHTYCDFDVYGFTCTASMECRNCCTDYCVSPHLPNQTAEGPIDFVSISNCYNVYLTNETFASRNFSSVTGISLTKNFFYTMPRNLFASPILSRLEQIVMMNNSIQHVPRDMFSWKSLKNLKILNLSHNKLSFLPPDLFSSPFLSNLETILLHHNTIKEVPVGLFSNPFLTMLKKIDLSNNNIGVLTPLLFQSCNLSNLVKLHLSYNKIIDIPDGFFSESCLTGLQVLHLQHNRIKILTGDVFRSKVMSNLKEVPLFQNKISLVHESTFSANPLSSLGLNNNSLTILPSNMFSSCNLSNMDTLDLSFNQLSLIPDGLFTNSCLSGLRLLKLAHNNINSLNIGLFNSSRMSNLLEIQLNNNKITSIHNTVFSSKWLVKLYEIDLTHNKITNLSPDFSFGKLRNIENIYLSNNDITVCPEVLFKGNLTNLRKIYLRNNKIEQLPHLLLQGLESLLQIDFSNNRIKTIPPGFLNFSFQHSHFVKTLSVDFSHNLIKKIGTSFNETFYNYNNINMDFSHNQILSMDELFDTIKTQKKPVVKFKLAHNQLTEQNTAIYKALNQFSGFTLDISHNDIDHFEVSFKNRDGFRYLFSVIIEVDIASLSFNVEDNIPFHVTNLFYSSMGIDINKITDRIDPHQVAHLHVFIDKLKYRYFCNCDMYNYLRFLNSEKFKRGLVELQGRPVFQILPGIFTSLVCGAPAYLEGKLITEVTLTDFNCLANENCTSSTFCNCVYTPENNTMTINCTHLNITDESLPKIRMTNYSIELFIGLNLITNIAPLKYIPNLALLDVSHNKLKEIFVFPATYFQNTMVINAASNYLTTLPNIDYFKQLTNLKLLKINGNPFNCTCDNIEIKKTLLNIAKIVNLSQVLCASPENNANRVITELLDSEFGCPVLSLIVIIAPVLSLLLFLSIVVIFVYVFREYIMLFLFTRFGWRLAYGYSNDPTKFDIFISYSSKDSDWVLENLVDPLENLNPSYKLCVHERDFVVGIPIYHNIKMAVENSKCTVVVVSQNWLKSEWCQAEFRVAHCVGTVEKKIRLLVVLMEPVADKDASPDLKLYMKTFTYLDIKYKLFWAKLLSQLPRPQQDRNEQIELGHVGPGAEEI